MSWYDFSILTYQATSYDINLDFAVYLETYKTFLQRGLVWTQQQKEQFILSVLRGTNSSKFVVVQHKEHSTGFANVKIIDGKQRITTIMAFIRNEFPIHLNGNEIFYDDLDPACKREITDSPSYKWDFHYSYPQREISDDTLVELFEQINFFGTPQEADHLEKIKANKV